ncbi:signal peptide peptidase SppA [Aestuariimicrobium ganziense]|uniref:signal peptide peptidase SppA n=1 Tax=Aestuariimicrobium ganziense TaxID=2773677 RepID=UPI001944F450|nr:signal peptide peptidase SppA [Aestuariimicrobium ganziense]
MDVIGLIKGLTGDRTAAPRTILEIDMARGVLASPPDNPLAALRAINSATLGVLREGLRHAAKDERVVGLVVHVAPSGLGLAETQELAEAIASFGEHKPTIAWAQTYGELGLGLGSYLLAAHCHEVWLQPSGELSISGVHLGITLMRGLLEKGGVEPQFGQRHEYKSAADQFSATEITEANREMTQRLADSIVDDVVATIAKRRGKSVEQVREAVDSSPLSPQQALDAGLIDHIGYRDEVYAHLYQEWNGSRENLKFVTRYDTIAHGKQIAKEALDRKAPIVGVVSLRGPIVTGRGRPAGPAGPQAGGDVIADHLRATCRDDRIKAVVLKIDSPGGSAVASDTIWRAVHQVRESGRPVVAVMSTVAASGGYYAAMGANEIVAQPATLTGSIGVLAGKFVTAGLMDKLALKHEGRSAGRRAQMMASDREFTEDEWHVLNRILDDIYEQFTTKAAADRGMDHADLERLARGRVWTGADAKENGLVDHLGGVSVALDRVCELAGLDRDRAHVRAIPQLGLLDRVRPADSTESQAVGGGLWVPTDPVDALLQRGIAALGLERALAGVTGPLSLPWSITIKA